MASTLHPPLKGYFIPHLALSHTLPMVHLAELFAARGVDVTVVTVPYYNETLQKSIKQNTASSHKLNLRMIDFPYQQFGLPEKADIYELSNSEAQGKIFTAFYRLRHTFEQVIREKKTDFLVADSHCFWATDLAAELGIPRLVYHGTSYLGLCIEHSLNQFDPHNNIPTEDELFEVPNLPGKIMMRRSEIADHRNAPRGYVEILNKIVESTEKSYGVIVESFDALELEYANHYRNFVGRKAWSIGPLLSFHKRINTTNQPTEEKHACLSWLDSQNPKSVVYVSFGSLTTFSSAQMLEMARALETSGHPFIWVVRKNNSAADSEDSMMDEFEKIVTEKNIGFLVKGWAPQTLILNHPAIGGFLTHCGWNSVVESIIAGVPMITWPISADHFNGEKLVTQVLGVGVEIGVGRFSILIVESYVSVSSAKITAGVKKLMDDREQANLMRERLHNLSEEAVKAVEEGGSSYNHLNSLVKDLVQISQSKKAALSD